jgi:hypothetical protein
MISHKALTTSREALDQVTRHYNLAEAAFQSAILSPDTPERVARIKHAAEIQAVERETLVSAIQRYAKARGRVHFQHCGINMYPGNELPDWIQIPQTAATLPDMLPSLFCPEKVKLKRNPCT